MKRLILLLLLLAPGCDRTLVDSERQDDRIRQMAAEWPAYRAPYVPDAMVEAGQNVADQIRSINRPAPGTRPTVDRMNVVKPYYEWNLEETAIDALGRIGPPSVPRLRVILQSDDPAQRQQAADMLARIGPLASDAVPDLILALEDASPQVRRTAARALGQMGPEAADAVDALFRIIQQESRRPAPPAD